MKRKSWTEPNWVGTPRRDRYPLLFTPQSCHYCIIDQCLLHSLWMNPCLSIVMVCENGIFFFFFLGQTTVLSSLLPTLWALVGGSLTEGNPAVKKTTRTSGKKTKQPPINKPLSSWVNLTPGSLTFWLQRTVYNLPWYAHVDILTITWYIFFPRFSFLFFLMVCKSI